MDMKHFVLSMFFALLLTACDGNESQNSASRSTIPSPTAFPTFAFNAPTEAPQVATAAARSATQTAEVANTDTMDPVLVQRGLGRYEALACGSCHGATGEGTENGPLLLAFEQSQETFIEFLRTGGELGDEHRFPAERLSNSGIVNLYYYVRSLGR